MPHCHTLSLSLIHLQRVHFLLSDCRSGAELNSSWGLQPFNNVLHGKTATICSFPYLHSEVFESFSISCYPPSLQRLSWCPQSAEFLHCNTGCCPMKRGAKYLRQLIFFTRKQSRTCFFNPKTSLNFFNNVCSTPKTIQKNHVASQQPPVWLLKAALLMTADCSR